MEGFFAPFVAAEFIFISTTGAGLIVYSFLKTFPDGSFRTFLQDFVKTTVLCAHPFGHAIMWKFYGGTGFLLGMIPLMVLYSRLFTEGDDNPVVVWIKYFKRVIPLWLCLLKTVVQLFAGLAAYRFGMFLYRTELHDHFSTKITENAAGRCTSTLNVPIVQGFLIEMAGTAFVTWFAAQSLTGNKAVDGAIKVANTGIVVVAGFYSTGSFLHPPKASGITFGCGNTPSTYHVVVYWLGPLVGAWLSSQLQNRFKLERISDSSKKGTKAE
ncbi:AQP11-like protein [Mya arenaria]|uniref:AQP11-like protein n=1 Tax=Mya arenaria TaxID=6604 RepID=A0ABY7DB45_MYAAR|nr:aquaporin-11-like [Mya arenaria]XP_052808738.1 aquaporin-11-like [Mya arenaria]WAQ94872.1 AQP11-like protein [Mya arenaria]